MKMRRAFAKAILVFYAIAPLTPLLARDVPFLSGHINDTADMLMPETRAELEQLLTEHETRTSNQVVVLTISSLEGEVLEEYSERVATAWKLGQQSKDNGVLLLIAQTDRKLRIEVGYGLEGDLTDARCAQIIRNEMVPRLREGDPEGAVRAGVMAIIGTIEGSYVPGPDDAASFEDPTDDMPLFLRLMIASIFLIVIGPFTFFALFDKGWFLYFFLMPFYLTFPLMFLGIPGNFIAFALYSLGVLLARLVLPRAAGTRTWYTSRQTSFGSSSGSSSSDWSSDSSSGGGYSGGGGSFGGGGSSGSW